MIEILKKIEIKDIIYAVISFIFMAITFQLWDCVGDTRIEYGEYSCDKEFYEKTLNENLNMHWTTAIFYRKNRSLRNYGPFKKKKFDKWVEKHIPEEYDVELIVRDMKIIGGKEVYFYTGKLHEKTEYSTREKY